MAATSTANPNIIYMRAVAGGNPQPSNKKANQSYISRLSALIIQLGADPVDDYGPDKKTFDKSALAHLSGVGAAIEALAALLVEISTNSNDSAKAIAASGFTQYFAQYYCQTHGLTPFVAYTNTDNLANKCNSQVIAPTLEGMLSKVKKN